MVSKPEISKKHVKIGLAGLAVVALVIGLSVGLTSKNSSSKSSAASNASGGYNTASSNGTKPQCDIYTGWSSGGWGSKSSKSNGGWGSKSSKSSGDWKNGGGWMSSKNNGYGTTEATKPATTGATMDGYGNKESSNYSNNGGMMETYDGGNYRGLKVPGTEDAELNAGKRRKLRNDLIRELQYDSGTKKPTKAPTKDGDWKTNGDWSSSSWGSKSSKSSGDWGSKSSKGSKSWSSDGDWGSMKECTCPTEYTTTTGWSGKSGKSNGGWGSKSSKSSKSSSWSSSSGDWKDNGYGTSATKPATTGATPVVTGATGGITPLEYNNNNGYGTKKPTKAPTKDGDWKANEWDSDSWSSKSSKGSKSWGSDSEWGSKSSKGSKGWAPSVCVPTKMPGATTTTVATVPATTTKAPPATTTTTTITECVCENESKWKYISAIGSCRRRDVCARGPGISVGMKYDNLSDCCREEGGADCETLVDDECNPITTVPATTTTTAATTTTTVPATTTTTTCNPCDQDFYFNGGASCFRACPADSIGDAFLSYQDCCDDAFSPGPVRGACKVASFGADLIACGPGITPLESTPQPTFSVTEGSTPTVSTEATSPPTMAPRPTKIPVRA